MKKCPRCNHDVKDNDKFCPRCGLDLGQSNMRKAKPMTGILHIIVIASLLTIPFLYSFFLNGLTNQVINNNSTTTQLKEYTKKDAMMLLYTFDNLTDYQTQFSNVSEYVSNIQNYEKTLSQDGNIYDKQYLILVLDNNNVVYQLKYTTEIDDTYEMTIIKEFDRIHSYNTQQVIFKKADKTLFADLLLNEEEQNMISYYIHNDSKMKEVVDDFSLREDEFLDKKEDLGHFGIGSYSDKTSFVVEKYGETYTSIFNHKEDVTEFVD